jgi:integrase
VTADLRCLPIEDWPAIDRAVWIAGVQRKGLFDPAGVGANWSDGSRRKTAGGYGYWLSWLARRGVCDSNVSPADRVSRERVGAYVAELRVSRAPYTVLCRVQELYDALRLLAPGADWDWLVQIYRTLRTHVRPARDKVSRLRPIDELAALGERLMEEAEAAPRWSPRRRAVAYRDGFMIALLAYRPTRPKNFAMMRLGRHLTKVGGCWQILFAADETKSRIPYEATVPSALVPRLERYLDLHRPVLLRGESGDVRSDIDAVWVSEIGTPLEKGALARRIADHTKAAFGRRVSPHMFRDAAATSIAVDNPKHIGDASLVLGHAGHRMTEKHYNHARSLEASRRHTEMLKRLRETLKSGRNR